MKWGVDLHHFQMQVCVVILLFSLIQSFHHVNRCKMSISYNAQSTWIPSVYLVAFHLAGPYKVFHLNFDCWLDKHLYMMVTVILQFNVCNVAAPLLTWLKVYIIPQPSDNRASQKTGMAHLFCVLYDVGLYGIL